MQRRIIWHFTFLVLFISPASLTRSNTCMHTREVHFFRGSSGLQVAWSSAGEHCCVLAELSASRYLHAESQVVRFLQSKAGDFRSWEKLLFFSINTEIFLILPAVLLGKNTVWWTTKRLCLDCLFIHLCSNLAICQCCQTQLVLCFTHL